jgi:hypothetical protein
MNKTTKRLLKNPDAWFFTVTMLLFFYFFGAMTFGYDLPEFLAHKPTEAEAKASVENMTLPVKYMDLRDLLSQRDSMRKEIDRLKATIAKTK